MDEFLILLQAKLDEAKSKGNVNADIEKIQNQIDKLKLQAEIDPKTISNLTKQLENILNQKIVISNIGINQGNATKIGKQTGQQIGNAINQEVEASVKKANSALKSFSQLKIGTGNINAIIDKDGLVNVEKSLNKIKQFYSEFGQVKITDMSFDSEGTIQKFKVNIEQVNGELKETRSFVMALNGTSFAFPDDVIKGSESIVQHLDKTKNVINETGEAINNLALKTQIDKIQLSMDNGYGASEYQNRINTITASLEKYGVEAEEAKKITSSLQSTFDSMKGLSGQELVTHADKLEQEFKSVKASVEQAKLSYDKLMQPVSNEKATSLINRINTFLSKNTRITNDAKIALQGYADELGRGVNLSRWNEINGILKKTENSMRGLGRLGASLKDQMSQAAQSFTQWLSVSSVVMLLVSKIKNAITELKEVNSIMTEISKTADQLSKTDLSNVESSAYNTASKYGKKASNYLTGIQEMYRAGYENAEDLAELSTLAQAAGDMQADLANDYLIATDAAYKLKGNTEALNTVLDGQNYITNRNALSMQDLAEATKIAASQSASSGIAVDKATAAMGTMIAATRQGGDVAARAWKGILMNIQQVEGEVEDGEIIDAESLSKYEAACKALGVSLKEVKDGVISLRDPMKILEELSNAYTSLDESDARRANLISAVGGKYRGNQLNALLENWSLYEKMLKDYAAGSGSALEEAMKSANNWEGSMNRLGNTFTKVVNNIVKSDAVIAGTNGLNSLLSIIDKVTSKIGSLGTIGIGGSLILGRDKSKQRFCPLWVQVHIARPSKKIK